MTIWHSIAMFIDIGAKKIGKKKKLWLALNTHQPPTTSAGKQKQNKD